MSARLFPVPTNDQSESGFAVAKSLVHRGGKPLINLVVKNAWLGLRALVAPPDKFRIINLQRWFSLPHPGLPKVPLFPRENLCIGGIIHFRSHRSIDAEVFPGRISLPSPGLLVCLLAPRGIDARRSIGKSWADRSSQSQGNPSRRQTTVDTHGFYLPLGPFDSPDDFAIGRDRGSTLTVPGCPSPSSCLSPPPASSTRASRVRCSCAVSVSSRVDDRMRNCAR
ncbi:hypothetical protein VTN31DRAFT_1054 [Thermomyces dupontii]|uniref:uncharacterized protein n=1 Tax=Talaromyces thermophilus TaxID=28565 RepID=UPI00374348AA